ncbi:MAG: dTDP-4-dehydrorhamnose reductase [Candidatus Hadarchaeales archaeon]
MEDEMKLLITGSSGLLGSKLVEAAKDHEVLATYGTKPLFPDSVRMDITSKNEVLRIVSDFKPDVVVHTAAETDVDGCELNKGRAWQVNVGGTKNIAEACAKVGASLVYVSTDYVFDGEGGLYTEEDVPNPINYYGLTKLEGEKQVMKVDGHLIARTSVLYGWHPWKKNFATWLLNSLREQKQIAIVDDHYNSPTLADNLAELLLEAVKKGLTGLYHIAGRERVSRFRFALEIARIFELNGELIKPIKMAELKAWVAKRPRDSSLRVDKIERQLKIKPLNVSEGLRLMKERAPF